VVAGYAVASALVLHVPGQRRVHVQPVGLVVDAARRDMRNLRIRRPRKLVLNGEHLR